MIFGFGLSSDVRKMVEQQYAESMKKERWKTAYAATNANEFFAELTMWYVGSRGDFGKIEPKPLVGQEWLRQYDPDAFMLLDDIYSGRIKVQRITYTQIAAHPASEEGLLRTTSSSQPTKIVFDNRTSQVYKLFWLDGKGQRKPFGEIHPGEKHGQATYATHPWVIVNPDESVLGIFVAEKRPGKVEIWK
jgi:VHL beta domain